MQQVDARDIAGRATVVSAVQTPLGMLVLSALISEAILASTIFALDEPERLTVVYLVVAMVVGFVAVTVFVAWKKPDALYGRMSVDHKGFAEETAYQVFHSINPSLTDQQRLDVWSLLPGNIEKPKEGEREELVLLRVIISKEVLRHHQITNGNVDTVNAVPPPIDEN